MMAYTIGIFTLLHCSTCTYAASTTNGCHVGEDANVLLQSNLRLSGHMTSDSEQKEEVSEAVRTWRPGQADALLQSLEAMMHISPPVRNMSQLKVIETIVKDTLLPGVAQAHDFAQKQLVDSKARIDDCISAAVTGLETVSNLEDKTSQSEKTHKNCRDVEAINKLDMTTKCDALDTFLKNAVFPPIPSPAEISAMRPVLHQYKLLANEFENKDNACNTSTSTHVGQQTTCNGGQATFESHFCEYRLGLTNLESSSTSCYDEAKTSHNSLEQTVQGQVVKWTAEYKAIKKIMCYLNVWLGDGNLSTVNANLPSSCQNDAIDTTAMDIVYPTVPAETTIDVSPVQDYPGTQGFLDRYEDLPSHNSEVASCITTTTTTTTEATATNFEFGMYDASKDPGNGWQMVQSSSELNAMVKQLSAFYNVHKLPPVIGGWKSQQCCFQYGNGELILSNSVPLTPGLNGDASWPCNPVGGYTASEYLFREYRQPMQASLSTIAESATFGSHSGEYNNEVHCLDPTLQSNPAIYYRMQATTTATTTQAAPLSAKWRVSCGKVDSECASYNALNWIVRYVAFYSDVDCSQQLSTDTPIASSEPHDYHPKEDALDAAANDNGWQCKGKWSPICWIGVQVSTPTTVKCVKYRNADGWGYSTNTLYLWAEIEGDWQIMNGGQPLNLIASPNDTSVTSGKNSIQKWVQA